LVAGFPPNAHEKQFTALASIEGGKGLIRARVLLDGTQDIWVPFGRRPSAAQRIALFAKEPWAQIRLSVFKWPEIGLTPMSTSWKRSENDSSNNRKCLFSAFF